MPEPKKRFIPARVCPDPFMRTTPRRVAGGQENASAQTRDGITPEFRAEAVRLAHTSGRSRRKVAEDLGIGLSTLRHWIDGQRDREMEAPPSERQEDMAAELKRLRRENEVLRQEREILKRATAFFAKEGSR